MQFALYRTRGGGGGGGGESGLYTGGSWLNSVLSNRLNSVSMMRSMYTNNIMST